MTPMTRAALKAMSAELGLWETLKVGVMITYREMLGHPFRALSRAKDRRQRESRKQLGPAVLLYQHLSKSRPQALALEITARVIEASGHAFLSSVMGTLDPRALLEMEEGERSDYLRPKLEKVPNAIFSLSFTDEEVHFTVTDCSFVSLCHQLMVPELAPLFCAVDDHFFGGVVPGIKLSRATTIASGGETCPFVFTFEEDKSDY